MALLSLDADNAIYFEHHEPTGANNFTFVFVNALTGNTTAWESVVAPALRDAGHGTLSYNFRGQDDSSFHPDLDLTPNLIIQDLKALLSDIKPNRLVLVGLSIGGLFAAHAVLQGVPCEALVLLNTLREIGPRIAWVNDAMPMIVGAGGVPLFLDALFPLLVNPDFAAKARDNFVKGDYQPLDPAHGHANLMRHAAKADWDIPYEKLSMPVHVITGLHDRVFLDRDIVEKLFERLPNASREEWDDAGHLLPQERPEKLAQSLLAFVQRIAG